MCCCCRHHDRHHRVHHHGEACGCGSRREPCGETGHENSHEVEQALERLHTQVRAIEERIATLEAT